MSVQIESVSSSFHVEYSVMREGKKSDERVILVGAKNIDQAWDAFKEHTRYLTVVRVNLVAATGPIVIVRDT